MRRGRGRGWAAIDAGPSHSWVTRDADSNIKIQASPDCRAAIAHRPYKSVFYVVTLDQVTSMLQYTTLLWLFLAASV